MHLGWGKCIVVFFPSLEHNSSLKGLFISETLDRQIDKYLTFKCDSTVETSFALKC